MATCKRDWRNAEVESPLTNLLKTSPLSTPPSNTSSRGPITPNNANAKEAKLKSVAEKATIGKIVVVLLMYLCKKVLLVRVSHRVLLYLAATLIISIITDHFPPPLSFLAEPTSLLNTLFLRHAWTWTCGINALFIYFTCVYHSGNLLSVNRSLMRLVLLSSWCVLYSYVSKLVSLRYGVCLNNNNNLPTHNITAHTCNGRWVSFRMCERAFVCVHCLLTCVQEMRSLAVWNRLPEVLLKQQVAFKTSQETLDNSKLLYQQNEKLVKLLVLLVSVTVLLLDVQLLATLIYFDNMPQKLLAVLFGVLGWLLSYKSWFPSKPSFLKSIWSPGLPGQNLFVAPP